MRKRRAWILVGLWMVLIFLFSAQPGSASGAMSRGITAQVVAILNRLPFLTLELSLVHVLLRKGAHFFVYLVLGMLAFKALSFDYPLRQSAGRAWLLATAYAVTDEVHQLFVPGRHGAVTDVLIDGWGAATGIALMVLWQMLRERRRRPAAEDKGERGPQHARR